MSAWVYVESGPGLFTVGHYSPAGEWHADSDHPNSEAAAERCHWLNGGSGNDPSLSMSPTKKDPHGTP